ncbi:hypothetical protein [Streptomyces sp. WMMB 322]|uniref:hypothetical protein n=1 Tax=Streptomyces sp. WMMB 322 TaxID=1286821 RepID=UPI0006E449FE|nr:hypothetical protein [Streptomyces sp. WMMB 322]SCK05044.1 hypothetical protein H180DRAFT_00029 [Streptomyces sp. WMMB 322]
MNRPNRRSTVVGLAALGASVIAGGTAYARSPLSPHPQDPPLHVVTGEDGFSAPESAPEGAVAFRLRTTSPLTGAVGLARLREGVSEADFRTRLRRVFATEGQENIEAARALMAAAELHGGGFTHVGTDTGFTAQLDAGRYLLLEFLDFEGDRGRNPAPGREYLRPLTVHPPRTDTSPAPPCATLTAVDIPGRGPRFALHGQVRPGRPLRYVNRMRDQVDELVLYPVPDDSVTEEDIQAFFDDPGRTPPFDIGRQLGTPPLSPGRGITLTPPLTTGRYAAITWVTSIRDARPLSAHGQHRIITVR